MGIFGSYLGSWLPPISIVTVLIHNRHSPFLVPENYLLATFLDVGDLIEKKQNKTKQKTKTDDITALMTFHSSGWRQIRQMYLFICLFQEATVIILYGTTDRFRSEKGVWQDCLLSPCLFNLYAEHIMRNAGLEELQAGIKIGWNYLQLLDMEAT